MEKKLLRNNFVLGASGVLVCDNRNNNNNNKDDNDDDGDDHQERQQVWQAMFASSLH